MEGREIASRIRCPVLNDSLLDTDLTGRAIRLGWFAASPMGEIATRVMLPVKDLRPGDKFSTILY